MDFITTPSGIRLIDGTVVMLARFPGTKWVVRNGWYSYEGSQNYGWYFSSIPAQTVIPVNNDDLSLLVVVSGGVDGCCGCSPKPPGPPGPPPPGPPHNPIQFELDRTFITVQTIEERDRLNKLSLIPDGKLVRVNHIKDENEEDIGPKYYRYDRESDTFVEVFFENEVSGEEFEELKETVQDISGCLEWIYL